MRVAFSALPGPLAPGTLGYDVGSQSYSFEPTAPVALVGSLVAQFLHQFPGKPAGRITCGDHGDGSHGCENTKEVISLCESLRHPLRLSAVK